MIQHAFKRAVAAALLLALAACATVSNAPVGAFKVGESYSVTLGRQWSDVSGIVVGRPKYVRLLSIDGPQLNRLYLSGGITPGAFFVKPAEKEKPTPVYRAGLSETEIAEFITDSVAALGYQRPENSNLRPAKFGAADGVRLDISTRTAAGLEMSGTALAAERGGKLHVILYLAPTEHYYQATLAEAEAVMASATLR